MGFYYIFILLCFKQQFQNSDLWLHGLILSFVSFFFSFLVCFHSYPHLNSTHSSCFEFRNGIFIPKLTFHQNLISLFFNGREWLRHLGLFFFYPLIIFLLLVVILSVFPPFFGYWMDSMGERLRTVWWY